MMPKKIAVIGSGVAGLTAAYLLDKSHDVTLFEKAGQLGGHTHTVEIPEGPDAGTPVDTGFIVYNERNYPLLCRLFERLQVKTENSDMAFGVTCLDTGLEYCSDFPFGLFARKRNVLDAAFLSMVSDIFRMNKLAKQSLQKGDAKDSTLRTWLKSVGASKAYCKYYLLPMGAAIWSTPTSQMLDFPAAIFLRFFENHGLWDFKHRPQWRFVSGGGQSYVKKIAEGLRGKIQLNSGVVKVRRLDDGVEIQTEQQTEKFDAVVLAAHADESLGMLQDPSEDELKVLSVWKYTLNEAVLHWDERLMPKRRAAWASWNVRVFASDIESSRLVALTYWMNRLQKLKTSRPYFVTLNATSVISPEKIIKKINFTHPYLSFRAIESQKKLPLLNGVRNTYFCGSYFGYGFHEDAVRSAVEVAKKFGVSF